ncbi:MAG: hypothetical protein EHM42_07670 [Planctomycetaceae bacterium]|nr:MAG: hypothetical protein EHM42_07670 [Planctomycetaceae bacterium]
MLLPDGSILTAFGTGYRCQKDGNGQSSPRDVGLIHWRVAEAPDAGVHPVRDASADSELRNGFDPSAGTPAATPVYQIHRTGTPIAIDGRLDEPAWFAAPEVGPFQFTWHKHGTQEQSVAKLLWDDENLYVAHICEDAHITARHTQHDGPIPEDDCFEVIFAPDPARPDVYFNIEWNVIGGYVDNHRPEGPKKPRAKVWDAEGVRIAGTFEGTLNDDSDTDSRWTVEVSIPLRNFAKYMPHMPPQPGSHWNLNLNRHGGQTNAQYSQWSRADTSTPSFHTPHRFGKAEFSATTAPFDR